MADIRKRTGAKGTTYQVRSPNPALKSGYSYSTFETLKAARNYLESGATQRRSPNVSAGPKTIDDAVDLWLKVCEKEGLNGREPVSDYTRENYEYRAKFIKAYGWTKPMAELTTPDIVAFRSWLLTGERSRALASKVLSSFFSVMKEMTIRGHLPHNPAIGVSIRSDSRYREPVTIPSRREIIMLLGAADSLANSPNETIAKAWKRYRPMLYLAVDSGMRPQEYLALAKSAIRSNGVQVDRALEGSGAAISVTKTPAGRRFIELSPDTIAMIRTYADDHAPASAHDLVFPASNGEWQSRRNWQRRGFDIACEKAGLMETVEIDGESVEQVKYRPYDLRHFFASMLIERRVNLKKIQALMGHTNIETTLNVYGHLLDEQEVGNSSDLGLLSSMLKNPCGKSVATTR